ADVTKLQILTLAAKLVCLNPSHHTLHLLLQYVLNLARYDLNYDVRDRARFLRGLVLSDSTDPTTSSSSNTHLLHQHLKQILLSEKEVPVVESPSSGRERFTVGSLSLLLNRELPGYEPLPDHPSEQPDPTVRETKEEQWTGRTVAIEKGFGSDDFGSNRYRGSGGFAAGPLQGKAAAYAAPKAKKKGDDYDLDAFYNEEEEEEEDEEEDEDEDEDEDEEEEEESEEESEDDEDESEDETDETEETTSDQDAPGPVVSDDDKDDGKDNEGSSDDDFDYQRQASARLLGAR
ncbi:hypothetical protein BC938DRAFT_472447, partial [Jimgerdemannia flammicorona]